jgi:very-short-patch-repair endonuclease
LISLGSSASGRCSAQWSGLPFCEFSTFKRSNDSWQRSDDVADQFWPQQRVIVETDGKAVHDNPLAFERDRKRDRELLLSGYRVARFTHRQVEKEPEAVIAAICDLVCGNFG